MPNDLIRLRKDGRYELRTIIGTDESGKKIHKYFYASDEKECFKKRDRWLKERNMDSKSDSFCNTEAFDKWAERWLIIYKKNDVRPYTYEHTYCKRVYKYLIPYFNNTPLTDITNADVKRFFVEHDYLAIATLKTLKVVLNDIFVKAINNDLCRKNPVTDVKLRSTKINNERNYLNAVQQRKAIEWCIDNSEFALLTMLKTGMRRGEVLGLRWCDINFYQRFISVNQSMSPKLKDSDLVDMELKTKCSQRLIPIDDELIECLKSIDKKSDLVFPYASPNAFAKHAKRALDAMCEECNLPRVTPHELRHTFGTVLREQGVDIYTISKLMGHSSINVTASIYVHNDVEVLRKAMGFN